MALTYKYIEKIAKLTRQIVLKNNNNNYSNPDSLELNDDIKTSMGVKILYTDTNDQFNGCLLWDSNLECPEIIVSRQDSLHRQEFTVAHELGHLLLHWKWLPDYGMNKNALKYASTQSNVLDIVPLYRGKRKNLEDSKEKEANEFASDFLMPSKGIQQIYSKHYNDSLSLNDNANNVKGVVSRRFNVSKGAAYERILNMQNNGELEYE